jgi:hypothetical protein
MPGCVCRQGTCRPASSSVIYLDGSTVNGGGATGDSFVRVENIDGSATGPDFLVGNASVNRFTRNSGNDILWGAPGSTSSKAVPEQTASRAPARR